MLLPTETWGLALPGAGGGSQDTPIPPSLPRCVSASASMTQQLLSSPAPRPRPYRVCNWDRSLRKGIMAQSLAELLRQVSWGGLSVRLSAWGLSVHPGGWWAGRPPAPLTPKTLAGSERPARPGSRLAGAG